MNVVNTKNVVLDNRFELILNHFFFKIGDIDEEEEDELDDEDEDNEPGLDYLNKDDFSVSCFLLQIIFFS